MDRRTMSVCAVSLLWTALMLNAEAVGQAAEPASSAIRWQTDLQSAHRKAVRQNRPVLIVFGAEWCHFCTKLEQESLGHPQLAGYVNETFIPVHLDFDIAEREAKILGVESIPCVVALTPRAELIGRVDGFVPPKQMAEMLTTAVQRQHRLQQTRRQPAPQNTVMKTAQ